MTLKEKLRSNFPNSFDKTAKIFCDLIANDEGNASIEKVLTDLLAYMKEWKSSNKIYEQTGVMLEKSANLISYLVRFTDETDESFINRLNAIFVRGHGKVWGTPTDTLNVFKQYFQSSNVYLVENTAKIDDNKVIEYQFDNVTSDYWQLSDAAIVPEARFSKSHGVKFNANGTCKQTILTLSASKPYYLHFFHKGNLKVKIKSSDTGKYWYGSGWQNNEVSIKVSGTEWKDSAIFIKTDADTSGIELTFIGEKDTYLDLIRLSEYKFPSFSILVQIEGDTAKNALALTPGKEDPTENVNYKNSGYYDQDFLTGVSAGFAEDLYEDLLSYIKAEGVKAYLEIVNKDYIA